MSRVFDGNTANYLEATGLSIDPTNGFTVFAWVQLNDTGAPNHCVADVFNAAGPTTASIQFRKAGGGTHSLRVAAASVATASKGTHSLGVWRPWVGVWDDPNDLASFYIDDETSPGTAALASIIGSALTAVRLGLDSGGSLSCQAKVAYYAVWDRILGSTEIAALCNGTAPSDVSGGAPEYYWSLDDAALTNEGTAGTATLVVNGTVASDTGDNPTVTEGESSISLGNITPAKAQHGVTCSISGDQLQSARFSWNLYSAGGTTVLASLSQSAVSQATTSANILVFLRDFPYTDLTGGNWRIALHASAASASANGEASAELSVAHTAEDVWIWSEYNGETIPSSASAHSLWEGTTPTSGDQLRVLRALSGSAQFSELSADGTFVITSALEDAVVTAYPQEFSGSAFAWQASASVEINVGGQETQLAFSSAAAQSASYTQIFVHTVHTKDAEVMVLAQSTEPTTAQFEAVTQGTWASGVATVSGLATGSAYTIWVRISASGSADVTSFPAFTSIDPLSISAQIASAGMAEVYVHASASRTSDFMLVAAATADGQPDSTVFDANVYGSGLFIVATVSGLATASAYQIWVKFSSENSSEISFINVLTSSPPPSPLAFLSGPVALSADYTQIFVHAVASRSATLAVIAQATASGEPATADFDAVEFSALSAVATVSGLATGSAYRIWVRIDDGTSAEIESLDAATSAKIIVTASAAVAVQSRTFTQVVFLLTPDSSAAIQYVQTTASAPQPTTATFEAGSAGTLSATPVTATVSGLTTGESYRLWYRAVNADDEFISFLQFQTSAPVVEADSPARGNQIAVSRAFKIGL